MVHINALDLPMDLHSLHRHTYTDVHLQVWHEGGVQGWESDAGALKVQLGGQLWPAMTEEKTFAVREMLCGILGAFDELGYDMVAGMDFVAVPAWNRLGAAQSGRGKQNPNSELHSVEHGGPDNGRHWEMARRSLAVDDPARAARRGRFCATSSPPAGVDGGACLAVTHHTTTSSLSMHTTTHRGLPSSSHPADTLPSVDAWFFASKSPATSSDNSRDV